MSKMRWIVFLHTGFPGEQGFDLRAADSLKTVKLLLKQFPGRNPEASASAYPFTEEDWAEAQDFREVGCPFDYPEYILSFGPRGGVRVERV